MANTIILKRSNIPGKIPLVGDLELGEFAINTYDGRVYTKMNNGSGDTIIEVNHSSAHSHDNHAILNDITAAFTVEQAAAIVANTTDSHTHANHTILDATTEAFTTELVGIIGSVDEKAHIHENMTVLDATTEAFTTAWADMIMVESAKVGITQQQADAIVANTAKETNVTTDLSYTAAATEGTVVSSDGTNATIPAATQELAGLMTAADKVKLDDIEPGAEVNTVTSVAGKLGDVTLTSSDVGLGNVPNVDCTNASNITTGMFPTSVLPPLAIIDTHVVTSELAQLALDVQKGDVAIRTDLSQTFINVTGVNTAMSDWQVLVTPADSVLAVNGQVGAVVLTTSNIDEGTNLYYTETRVTVNASVAANTAARHEHTNKTILDATTEAFTVEQADAIVANTAKVGITQQQADAIVANTAKETNVTTDLSYTAAATEGTVVSSDGTDATIPAATQTLAGLLTAADKIIIDDLDNRVIDGGSF